MHLIYATEVMLFFIVISEHNSFAPFWLRFKNFVALKIGCFSLNRLQIVTSTYKLFWNVVNPVNLEL